MFPFAPHAGAGTSFSLLRQRKGSKRKATAGTGLAPPNFPHCTRFFGRARNLRLRRFEHASPCSPKNRAPFGCASRRVASLLKKWCLFCFYWYSELNLNQYSVGSPCRTICTVCGSPPCPDLNLIHYILQETVALFPLVYAAVSPVCQLRSAHFMAKGASANWLWWRWKNWVRSRVCSGVSAP